MTFKKGMRPVHPDEALCGEVLREEYLKLLGLSANALAKALRLSASRIGDIVLDRRGVTADTAVRFARYAIFERPSVLRKRSARCGKLKPLGTQQLEQTFPQKRLFTTIFKLRIYN